jgi:hypothetical protein
LTGFLNGLNFLLVNCLVLFSCWQLSNFLLRQQASLSLRLVATIILSFAHATLVVLLLGVVFRFLNAWSVPLLSVLVSALVLVFSRKWQQPFLRPAGQALSEMFSGRDYFLIIIAVLFTLQALVLLLKVIWLPPHVWDVFVYHLPPAVEWYQQGFIPPVLDTSVVRINGAPLGMTLLAYWFFIFFRDDYLVETPMLLWALSLVPVIFAAMRQSGVSRSWSFKFAVLIFFLPIVLMQGVTNKDHLGLNIGLIAGLLFLAEFLKHRHYSLLALAATAFGLVLGYKIAAPIHIMVALLVFMALLLFQHRSVFADRQSRLMLFKTVGLSAVIVFAVSGYWYLRNLLVYGRLHGAYGTQLSAAGESLASDSGAISLALGAFSNSWLFRSNLSELLPRIFDYANDYGADLVHISGFGPQFAAFGLIALAVAIVAVFSARLRQQPIFLLSCVAVLLIVALMFINFHANSYRILSFFPMVLIAYAGVLLYCSGWLEYRWISTMTSGIILLCIVWSGLTLLPPHYTNLLRLKSFISLDHDSRTSANYTSWFIRPRPSFYRIMDAVPVTEPIAYVTDRTRYSAGEVGIDTWTYLYMDRHWQRKTHALHLPVYFDCGAKGECVTKPALKAFMIEKQVSLLSSCKINRCLKIRDEALIEILPGLYYFMGNGR